MIMTNLEKRAKEIVETIQNVDTSKSDYFDGGSDIDPVELIGKHCGGDAELCNLVCDLLFNPKTTEEFVETPKTNSISILDVSNLVTLKVFTTEELKIKAVQKLSKLGLSWEDLTDDNKYKILTYLYENN